MAEFCAAPSLWVKKLRPYTTISIAFCDEEIKTECCYVFHLLIDYYHDLRGNECSLWSYLEHITVGRSKLHQQLS